MYIKASLKLLKHNAIVTISQQLPHIFNEKLENWKKVDDF